MDKFILHFKNLDTSIKTCFTSELTSIDVLTLNEKLLTQGFSKKRLDHFNTGRACAKKALSEIAQGDFEILKGEDGEPLWPGGFVGSISHTDGLYGAAVAEINNTNAIGLDIERIGKINRDMWDTLFTHNEQAFLSSVDVDELPNYDTLLFSLKESFYKAQYPFTKEKLWFTDLEVDNVNGAYQLVVLKEFESKHLIPESMRFFIENRDEFVVCLCLIKE